jgi:DNA-binding transcriptional regulator WhiA
MSIKNTKKGWSRGFTKDTHQSVKKISETMRKKRIDNFAKWRKQAQQAGIIRSKYPTLTKNGDLAELIGVILGDGHIRKFPRTDELSIFSNSNYPGFIERYARLVQKIFDHNPAITKHGKGDCTRIRIYQKNIASRLNIPYSPRKLLQIAIPRWVLKNNEFVVRYLRGLYEAEGCYCIHKPTSTYKVFFSNANISMLNNVFRLVKRLEFHPHKDALRVQISRKKEVFEFLDLIQFRKY